MGQGTEKSKRVTLATVAREAGVSIQTVSHVLTGNPTVKLPESTRERVRAAATKVGYQPNRHAQAIRSGKTNVIAIWMPVDRPIVSYLRMLHLVSQQAKRTGHELMIVPLDRETGLTEQAVSPNPWPVDGILAMDSGAAVERYRETHPAELTPVAVIGYELVPNGDAVAWNVTESVNKALGRMIEAGSKNIVFVTMNWQIRDFPLERRYAGYQNAMAEAGLTANVVEVFEESRGGARRAMESYIAEHGLPDGVFGLTDVLAAGAAKAIQLAGGSIPNQCQVLGYGAHADSEDFDVPITTLRSPVEKVIPEAWRRLMSRIENSGLSSEVVEFEMDYVERESTRQ